MKKSIRVKLSLGFGLCVLLIVGVVGFNFASMQKLERLYQQTLKRSVDMELATDAQHIGEEMYLIIANGVINRDMAGTERAWAASKEESLRKLGKVAAAADTPQEHAKVREAREAVNDIIRIFEQDMLPLITKGTGVPGRLADLDALVDRRIVTIDAALQAVAQSMSNENQQAERDFHVVLKNSTYFGLSVSLIGILFLLFVITVSTRRIVGPLLEITGAALEMQKGNYTVGLKHRSDDEIGVLADTFRTMSGQVEKRTVELQASNERLIHEINERKLAEEEVHRLNVELEQRVEERTAELMAANEQLKHVIAAQELTEEELKTSHSELRNLSRHLQRVIEEERATIAREIHDELGQLLTALKMDLSWLGGKLPKGQVQLFEKTREMAGQIDQTIKTVQRISAELRPGMLDDLGLTAAMEWQAQEFQKRTGIVCEVRSSFDCSVLDRCRSTAIFRIFQEALTNICRHAEATRVMVSVSKRDDTLVTTVTDNGKGITDRQISDSKSLGLIGMRERVRSFDGEVRIGRLSDRGTSVQVIVPLDRTNKEESDDKSTHRR